MSTTSEYLLSGSNDVRNLTQSRGRHEIPAVVVTNPLTHIAAAVFNK